MADRVFVVKMKPLQAGVHAVLADQVKIYGEHLILLRSNGRLSGMFLMECVESWTELPNVAKEHEP